jgi:hypothetical protein
VQLVLELQLRSCHPSWARQLRPDRIGQLHGRQCNDHDPRSTKSFGIGTLLGTFIGRKKGIRNVVRRIAD